MAGVLDRSLWPVVSVCVEEPGDLDALAEELERILDEEQAFGLVVHEPQTLAALHAMLWDAPPARRRMRRLRARLAAWCEATVHVLEPRCYERTSACELRTAQLIWGCAALSARTSDEATELLHGLLADRALTTGAGLTALGC